MLPRVSESALSYTHQVCNGLTMVANNRILNFDYALLEPNIQYSSTELFCHILNGEYPVPLRTYESKVPFTPNPQGVVEISVESDKSVLLTGLGYIDSWLQAYLLYDSAYLEMH